MFRLNCILLAALISIAGAYNDCTGLSLEEHNAKSVKACEQDEVLSLVQARAQQLKHSLSDFVSDEATTKQSEKLQSGGCLIPKLNLPEGGHDGTCKAGTWLGNGHSCYPVCESGYAISNPGCDCIHGQFKCNVKCEPKGCISKAVAPVNGFVPEECKSGTQMESDTYCKFGCDEGYTLKTQIQDNNYVKCFAGTMTYAAVQCIPKACTVHGIDLPPHTHFGDTCKQGTFTLSHGAACSLQCNDGYTRSGTQPYCDAGTFMPGDVACNPNDCTNIPKVTVTDGVVGSACEAGSQISSGFSCPVTCDEGFTLSGLAPFCEAGDFDQGSPLCTPKDCTVTGSLAPHMLPDSACSAGSMIPSGSECSVKCEPGYTESGTPPSCLSGTFSPGTAKCIANPCLVSGIGIVENGAVNDECTAGHMVDSGTTCSITCDEGYTLSGTQPSCLAGSFDVGSIQCTPNDCTVGDISPPPNGALTTCTPGSTLGHGDTCHITCASGYHKEGKQPSCNAGEFEPGSLSCVPNPCPVTMAISGDAIIPGEACEVGSILAHGASCEATCEQGYTFSGVQPSCHAGSMSPGSIVCTPFPTTTTTTTTTTTVTTTTVTTTTVTTTTVTTTTTTVTTTTVTTTTPPPTASPAPAPESTCTIYGDPHIVGFDKGPDRVSFLGMSSPTGVINDNFDSGDTWLVKSALVNIQGRYNVVKGSKAYRNKSFLRVVAIGGPFLNNNTLIIGRLGTKAFWNDKVILKHLPSHFDNELVSAKYHKNSVLVQDESKKASAPGVDIQLPMGINLLVNRGKNGLGVKISMPRLQGGQDGECGNYNSDANDDSAELISQRIGMGIPSDELLFHTPFRAKPWW